MWLTVWLLILNKYLLDCLNNATLLFFFVSKGHIIKFHTENFLKL